MSGLRQRSVRAQAASMQLNKLDAGSGSGTGNRSSNLVVHDDELGALGNMAYDLRVKLSKYGDHARQVTFEASIQLFTDGLETGSALTELHDAWQTQLSTLKEACAHISNHLDYTRASHSKDEDEIVTGMRNLDGKLMTVSRINDYIK